MVRGESAEISSVLGTVSTSKDEPSGQEKDDGTETVINNTSRNIFTFGSNEGGYHGGGAAKTAFILHGAIYGIPYGLQGNSFAIPTKSKNLKTLPLDVIGIYVRGFKNFAIENPNMTFNVTRVGCGLAGLTDEEMSPLFEGCPPNVVLPKAWGGTGFDW